MVFSMVLTLLYTTVMTDIFKLLFFCFWLLVSGYCPFILLNISHLLISSSPISHLSTLSSHLSSLISHLSFLISHLLISHLSVLISHLLISHLSVLISSSPHLSVLYAHLSFLKYLCSFHHSYFILPKVAIIFIISNK